MAILNRQLVGCANGLAYVSVDYDSGTLVAERVRYANTSAVPVLIFVNSPDGTEIFRGTIPAGTAEKSLLVPVARRWNIDDPTQAPSVNCAS